MILKGICSYEAGEVTQAIILAAGMGNRMKPLTGVITQKSLEDCGIIVDKTKLPFDKRPASVTNGIRLGTPIVTKNGMGDKETDEASGVIDAILKQVKIISDREYEINESFKEEKRNQVMDLCSRFPIC